MRSKKVTRYWCDHCNKGGLQPHAMALHELHCTLNPARACRVCNIINGGYADGAARITELLALLPDPTAYLQNGWNDCRCAECATWQPRDFACTNETKKLQVALDIAMPKLREATDNCPACIMAALRQKKIPVGMAPDFDFSAEMRTVFASIEPQQGYDY